MMENTVLRPQANPLSYFQLSQSQRQVCTDVFKMLKAYSDHNQSQSATGSIQTDRVSNLIFIDGDRGIGKSTLMLSLMYGCQSKVRDNFLKTDKSEQKNNSNYKWLEKHVWDKAFLDRLVWLDILDLELLPENTNLLASILVRIEAAFKNVSAFSESDKSSVLFPSTEKHPWTSFKKLMNDVSLGWDSSLLKRRTTDPDTYSQEQLRTERARLSFANFHETLEKVGKLYQDLQRLNEKPLFILPIDDADLNPQRYLELFKLTRLVHSSNLVFLVAGNVENLELLFELSFSKELNQISNAPFLQSRHDKIAGLAGKLGYAARRKLIPPAPHLIRIQPLTVEEGFDFKPENLPDVDPNEIYFDATRTDWTLNGLLQEITLPFEGPSQREKPEHNTLYRDYLRPALCLADLVHFQTENEKSSMVQLVGGPARAIHDLWFELYELIQLRQHNEKNERAELIQLVDFLGTAYRNALNESRDFPGSIYDEFVDLFLPTGGFSIQERIQRKVVVEPESLARLYESPNRSHQNYQFRKPGPLKLSLYSNAQSRFTLKDNWKNAWAYLLHDVSLLMPGNTIERLNFSRVTNYWAQSHIFARDNESVIMWPCPNWITFHYVEQFRLYWNACLEKMPNIEKSNGAGSLNVEIIPTPLNYLAYCWMWGITCLIYQPERLMVPEIWGDEGYGYHVAQRWEELASWISSMALETPNDWTSLRNAYKNEWTDHLIPRMLAPETGLPVECVKKFQSYIKVLLGQGHAPEYSLHLSPAWPRFAQQINEARAKSIIKYFDGKLMISVEQAKRNIMLLESYYTSLKDAEEIKTFNQNPIETFSSGKQKPLELSIVIAEAKEMVQKYEDYSFA